MAFLPAVTRRFFEARGFDSLSVHQFRVVTLKASATGFSHLWSGLESHTTRQVEDVMGIRFHDERYAGIHSLKRYYRGPCRWFKVYVNRVDRRKLNREVDKDDPEIPARWSHRNWGLWKWF